MKESPDLIISSRLKEKARAPNSLLKKLGRGASILSESTPQRTKSTDGPLMLVVEEASYMTGANVTVDSGKTPR